MAVRQNKFDQFGSSTNARNDEDFEEICSNELKKIKQQKVLYEKRMINSTERSMRLVDEAQQSAAQTEEELARQEESLLRTESNLDKINSDLEITNRHLKSMKSIWGSIGNYFRRAPESNTVTVTPTEAASSPVTTNSSNSHRPGNSYKQDKDPLTRKEPVDIVDKNLDLMSGGLAQLKDHAILMGQTLDRHNEILNRVTYKAEVADTKIQASDKKIKNMLK